MQGTSSFTCSARKCAAFTILSGCGDLPIRRRWRPKPGRTQADFSAIMPVNGNVAWGGDIKATANGVILNQASTGAGCTWSGRDHAGRRGRHNGRGWGLLLHSFTRGKIGGG